MKVWSLRGNLSYFSCFLPTLEAHLSTSATNLSHTFLCRDSQNQSVAVAMWSWLHQAQPHSVWDKIKKYNWMIFCIDAKPILDILRYLLGLNAWCVLDNWCAVLVSSGLESLQASSITLFFSETKWQYKRWILGLLHSKSLFTWGIMLLVAHL